MYMSMLKLLASRLVSFLPTEHQQTAADAVVEVVPTHLGTTVLILVCELACYRTVQALWQQPKGKALHFWAIRTTLFNMFVLGTAVHVTARIVTPLPDEKEGSSAFDCLVRVSTFIFLQNMAYYLIHMAMHTRNLYWIHRAHHQFTHLVLPSSANAVSMTEYFVAYILPPALLLGIVQPTKAEVNFILGFLSVCNILVHTPCIEDWCERHLPAWWVGTHVHGEHHRKWTTHFASPCLHLDVILQPLWVALSRSSTSTTGQKKGL